MLSNKFGGIAGAAMLGTAALLGTNAAHAIKINGGDDPAIYAKETVVDTDAIDKDGTKYYHLMKEHTLRAPLQVGAREADDWTVSYTFKGMVLSEAAVGTNLEYCTPPASDVNGDDRTDILDSTCNAISTAPVVFTGGEKGADTVTFLVSDQLASAQGGAELTAKFAISGDSADAVMTVSNITFARLGAAGDFTKSEPRDGVVKLASALDETAMKNDEVATVESSFKMFMSDITPNDDLSVARVGSFMVRFKDDLLNATNATAGIEVGDLGEIIDDDVTANNPPVPNSNVTFMGDFSFASMVHLDAADTCATASPTDLLIRNDDDEVTDMTQTMPVNVTSFATAQHLCITVDNTDEEMQVRIPETANYIARASYKSLADRVYAPMGMDGQLGMISRDGTTVRIPFVTTQPRYAQRIYVTNRGSADTLATFDFGDLGEVPKMLDSGTTVFKVWDDFGLDSGIGEDQAEVIIEAQPCMIDLSTILVNRELGTTDTVVYDTGCIRM